MKLKLWTLTLGGALALAACAPATTPAPGTGIVLTPLPAATAEPASGEAAAANAERLIIKNADLAIVVDDPLEAVSAIIKLSEGAGGFVVSTNTYQTTYSGNRAQQARMVIRVPADQLTIVLEQIKRMAVEVKSESISGQDVTADYVDLQSRLANLEAKEKQLQVIMEQTRDTESVLKVYDKLAETREQIEVIKGQMQYYKESAAFSAITLDILPNAVAQPIEVGGWHPEGTAKKSIELLARILQSLTDFLIGFTIVCAPFLIALGVPVGLVVRWAQRKRQKQQSETAEK